MKFLLIRHAHPLSSDCAEDDLFLPDSENVLSTRGRQAATELGVHLSRLVAGCTVVSSPLPRAFETATIIKELVDAHADIVVEPCLVERSFNFESSVTISQGRILQISALERPFDSVVGGESIWSHRQRVGQWLERILNAKHPPDMLLVVCHGGTIEHILFTILGVPVDGMREVYFDLPCAGYHELEYANKEWRIVKACATA